MERECEMCGNGGALLTSNGIRCSECANLVLVSCRACSVAGGADRAVHHVAPVCPWTAEDEAGYQAYLAGMMAEIKQKRVPDVLEDVRLFHVMTDAPVLDKPTVPSEDRLNLRVSLIREEAEETCRALRALRETITEAERDAWMLEVADGIADTIYVLLGTAHELGIPFNEVWNIVQEANMAKGVKQSDGTFKVLRRDDGKTLKPEGWEPPDRAIGELLKRRAAS